MTLIIGDHSLDHATTLGSFLESSSQPSPPPRTHLPTPHPSPPLQAQGGAEDKPLVYPREFVVRRLLVFFSIVIGCVLRLHLGIRYTNVAVPGAGLVANPDPFPKLQAAAAAGGAACGLVLLPCCCWLSCCCCAMWCNHNTSGVGWQSHWLLALLAPRPQPWPPPLNPSCPRPLCRPAATPATTSPATASPTPPP